MAEHKRFSRPFLLWFLLLFSMLMVCTVAGCSATPTPKVRDFRIDKLLIDVSVFPPGWYVYQDPKRYGEDRAQEDDRYIEFRSMEDAATHSMHIVFQYRDDGAAAYWYAEYLPAEFESAFRLTPWETSDDLQYHSQVADQFRFACADFQFTDGDSKRYTRCTAMGQYDEYVSVFFTYVSSDSITYADLERILKTIDERMAYYLERESK